MKKIKVLMHTPSNFLTYFVVLIMFAVGGFFIWRNAYDDTWRWIGMILLSVFFILASWLFLKLFRIFDWLVFTEHTVERHSLFGKKLTYQYSELYACVGLYTSVVESKKCLIFAPKRFNKIVTRIDTSKFGNVIPVNRLNFIYCPMKDKVIDLLRTRHELEWVDTSGK